MLAPTNEDGENEGRAGPEKTALEFDSETAAPGAPGVTNDDDEDELDDVEPDLR